MSSSVVSLVTVLLASLGQPAPLSKPEQAAWDRLKGSMVVILRAGRPVASAALVDASGLFVAHRAAVGRSDVDAKTFDGRLIRLRMKGADGTTQLVLLAIVGETPVGMRPLSAPSGLMPGQPMFAVLPDGPMRAEFVSGEPVGVLEGSRRFVPLSEVRFEAPAQTVGGALLVTYNGMFMGALSATLERRDTLNLGGSPGVSAQNLRAAPGVSLQKFGPSVMTVAYTAGTSVVRRAMEGFRSSEGQVDYPAIGAFCRDAVGGGALIQRVTPGSPAAQAGLREGDVILDIGGTNIGNQFDFARAVLDQKVGAIVAIRVRRGSAQLLLNTVVGKSDESVTSGID